MPHRVVIKIIIIIIIIILERAIDAHCSNVRSWLLLNSSRKWAYLPLEVVPCRSQPTVSWTLSKNYTWTQNKAAELLQFIYILLLNCSW